jgi:RNA recognition motif-containing protein
MKLIVRNIDRSITEAQLQEIFEPIGKVQYCNLVLDKATGLSKGFAFVEMPRPGEAKAAIKQLNGRQTGSEKLRVKRAEAPSIKNG